jgi:chemotaxis protein MotB
MAANNKGKRKKKSEGAGGFAVMFTSLSIILLAFFILLNSLAVIDQNNKLLALASLIGTFKILPGGRRFAEGDTLVLPSAPFTNDETLMGLQGLDAYIKTNPLGDQMRWYLRDYGMVVSLASSVLFRKGSTDISPEAEEALQKVAKVISNFSLKVQVEGHTDKGSSSPGQYRSQWELSGMQAVKVVRHFTERLGLEPERFSAVGLGSFWPVVPNTTAENRKKNRRVEIVLRGNLKALQPKVIDVKGFRFPVKGIWRW